MSVQFLIWPSAEVFGDLPPMLRPLRKQYTLRHPAAIDICHLPGLKDLLLNDSVGCDSFLMRLISGQNCNWPYSDAACFAHTGNSDDMITMSTAFLEHIRNLENLTLGPALLEDLKKKFGHLPETILQYIDQ